MEKTMEGFKERMVRFKINQRFPYGVNLYTKKTILNLGGALTGM
jgi:hypothetical protein